MTDRDGNQARHALTRRETLQRAGLGVAAGTLLAGGGAMSARAEVADPGNFLSVRDFGARGDGQTDDAAAFQACSDACGESGRAMYIPSTVAGYLIRSTVVLRCRHVFGDASHLGRDARGTLIRWEPEDFDDLDPCFLVGSEFYGNGRISHLTVHGNRGYERGRQRRYVNPSRLPSWSAFEPGVSAFGVHESAQAVFTGVSTRNVKVGLWLDSGHGHITSYDCVWQGLIGVYVGRNSEDYFFQGGGISGSWAGIVIGTRKHANHYGGAYLTMIRVHMGFSPYCFYQVDDEPGGTEDRTVAGLGGLLIDARFEQVGEAAIKLLPNSESYGVTIKNYGTTWSRIHRDWPDQPRGWAYNLPPDIIPYSEQQQWWAELGTFGDSQFLGWESRFFDASVSPHADNPKGMFRIAKLAGRPERLIVTGLSSRLDTQDIVRVEDKEHDIWHYEQRGPQARKFDFVLDSRAPVKGGNLLSDTTDATSFMVRDGSCEVQRTDAGAHGVAAMPDELVQYVGADPVVMRFRPLGGNRPRVDLPFAGDPPDASRRVATMLWWQGASLEVRVETDDGTRHYESSLEGDPDGWQLFYGVCSLAPRDGIFRRLSLSGMDPGRDTYLCGIMVSWDDVTAWARQKDPYTTGTFTADKGLDTPGSWSQGHLTMGRWHLWVDGSGRLRIKDGPPSSEDDGTPVGLL